MNQHAKIMDKQALVDVRIGGIRALIPPVCLLEEVPRTVQIARTVNKGRQELNNILRRVDDRLVVVVGPCSIHDPKAAVEYDANHDVPGLYDVAVGAIGARTTECQLHRELTSGLSMPIGFKNGTGGSLYASLSAGNDSCHVILRGGSTGPNYAKEHVDKCSELLKKAHQSDNIMIDCSHGNSKKDHRNQPGAQVANGDDRVIGVMIESNLVEGAQKLTPGVPLEYGKSITDACIGWDDTVRRSLTDS
ncbi:hypothetical protein DYB32_004717 [Aphanomyces invadans]|uniref:3-deoxy-7-phosphoheptulonate synthase n=1 Tax=Aphanomyces invadans TaxID=157072 RepID=A0A418AWM5_9STRA|nr:hypothetical protein DYB32_004717 [Aphanomyces invadans]